MVYNLLIYFVASSALTVYAVGIFVSPVLHYGRNPKRGPEASYHLVVETAMI